MFRCKCGSEEFYAHDNETIIVHYDGNGEEIDGGEIVDAEKPGWNKAFHCAMCDKAYSQLPPLDDEAEWLRSRERRYLNHSSACPICESGDVSGGSMDMDGDSAWQSVTCMSCGAEWDDIYKLNSVEIESYPTNYMPKNVPPSKVPNPNKVFKK